MNTIYSLQQLEAALAKAGTTRAAAALMGIRHHSVFRRALARARMRVNSERITQNDEVSAPKLQRSDFSVQRSSSAPFPASMSLPVAGLRAAVDPVARVLAAVDKMVPGVLVHERAVRAETKIGERAWRKLLRDQRLRKYCVDVRHKPPYLDGIYLGRAADIAAATNELSKAYYL